MSNNRSNQQQNKLIALSPEQSNPYLARAEQFHVSSPSEAANQKTPGHGQHGKTAAEKRKLHAEANTANASKRLNRTADKGADVNDATDRLTFEQAASTLAGTQKQPKQ